MVDTDWVDLGTEAVIARFWSRANVAAAVGTTLGIALLSVTIALFPAANESRLDKVIEPILPIPFGVVFLYAYLRVERNNVIATSIGVSNQALIVRVRAGRVRTFEWEAAGFSVTVWGGAFDNGGGRRMDDPRTIRVMITLKTRDETVEFYSNWLTVVTILKRAFALGVPISKDRAVSGVADSSPTTRLDIGRGVPAADRRDSSEIRRLVSAI